VETRSSMLRGPRENDPTINDHFLRFFSAVQEEAAKTGKVFFVYTGDGDVEDNGVFECETLVGWLVKTEDADRFQIVWDEEAVDETFDDKLHSAEWELVDDRVEIHFVKILPDGWSVS
jgi:hypothetical protein